MTDIDNMITSQEIIDNRIKEKELAKKKELAEAQKKATIPTSDMIDYLKSLIEKCISKISDSSTMDHCSVSIDEYTLSQWEKFRRPSVEEAKSEAIAAGFEVDTNLPWDDWSGPHPGYVIVSLPKQK